MPSNRLPTSPGVILQEEFLIPFNISTSEFAKLIFVDEKVLNNLISGQQKIDTDLAIRFEKCLGIPANTWLNFQIKVDVYQDRSSNNSYNKIVPIRHYR